MQNVAVLFEQAAEQFAAAYPENGVLTPWITEQLGVTEPYLRGKAGVALLLLRLVQRQLTGNLIPLCRDMLPIEDRAAAVPELESVQIWWHRWLGCGIGMGFSGWESLWQAADEALQLLPETLPASAVQRFCGDLTDKIKPVLACAKNGFYRFIYIGMQPSKNLLSDFNINVSNSEKKFFR